MKKFKLVLPLAFAAMLFSCKKDDSPKTNKDKLIGKWRIVAMTTSEPVIWKPGEEPTTDGYIYVTPCVADDYLQFKSGNVFEENEGATKCDPTADQVYTSEWSLDGDNLTIDGDPYKLISVDGSTLKVSQVVDYEEEENVTLTLTLKKK